MEREVFLVGRVEEGAMKDIGQKFLDSIMTIHPKRLLFISPVMAVIQI